MDRWQQILIISSHTWNLKLEGDENLLMERSLGYFELVRMDYVDLISFSAGLLMTSLWQVVVVVSFCTKKEFRKCQTAAAGWKLRNKTNKLPIWDGDGMLNLVGDEEKKSLSRLRQGISTKRVSTAEMMKT